MANAKHRRSLALFLEGEFYEFKESFRSHIRTNPLFKLRFDLPLEEYRRVTLERAKFLFRTPEVQKLFQQQMTLFLNQKVRQADNEDNFINGSLAVGEVVSSTDLSVGVKMGVMAWLFGGAVTNLGTESHVDRWFQPMKDLQFTGMFCMSERGHGSNVRGIQTEAHYIPETKEFLIHTPNEDARKIYIGNAMYGNYAAVFAQLYIHGENKGPHCFVVPIRDQEGNLHNGVTVEDLGLKEGLNGVDNGWVQFEHVRIPKENLLNRYADVTDDGKYVTSIERDGARFNTMLSALLGTRLALCFQAIAATKIGLEIAIKYGLQRRQFGPAGQEEQLLMDYQTHQLRLMPRLATTIALIFATRHTGRILNTETYHRRNIIDNRPLQALAAGLKAYTTWEAVNTLQVCRECTGGMGYMEENRLSNLKRDADVFVTFEGDNIVMLQSVVKELLVEYGKQFGGSRVLATVSTVMGNLRSRIATSPFARNTESVTSINFVKGALEFKESLLLRNLAARLAHKVSEGQEEPFAAWNDCLDHVTSLAWCHIYRVVLEQFALAIKKHNVKEDKEILEKLCELYAVRVMYDDRAWFLEQRYISANDSKILRDRYIDLCSEVRKHALEIVEAFCHPESCVHAPIAGVKSDRSPWAYYPQENIKARL